jgi:hypothetical protein
MLEIPAEKNMRFKIALLLVLLSGFTQAGQACTLATFPISKSLEIYPERVIVYGKITKVEARYSELETIQSLDNGTVAPDTIRIWDEKDFDCNGPFPLGTETMGSLGDTVLIIAPKITSQINGWDVIGEYRMPFFHSYASVFKFKNGGARYADSRMGIELKLYSGAEMAAIIRTYLAPSSLRFGSGSIRKSGGERVFDLRRYDLNGKSRPEPLLHSNPQD